MAVEVEEVATRKKRKRCPLRNMAPCDSECAWHVDGECAIHAIARNVSALVDYTMDVAEAVRELKGWAG